MKTVHYKVHRLFQSGYFPEEYTNPILLVSDYINNPIIGPFNLKKARFVMMREYISREDWQELASKIQGGYEPSLAAFIISRTNQFLDQGNLKS